MTLENTAVRNPVDLFLATLRAATAPMHTALEATPLSKALLEENVSLNAYVAYLHRMRDVVFFCEQVVFPLVQEVITDLPRRQKGHLIETDLAQLASQSAAALSTYHPFTTVDVAFALGYMYVLEGSTLGGRVILKHLASRLPVDERFGGAFVAGYGNETAAKWKTFLQQFCTYITDHGCESRTIAGAQHAFTSITQHFDNRAE